VPDIIEMVLKKAGSLATEIGINISNYHQMLVDHLGEKLAMGVYLCLAILLLLVVFKAFKLAFNLLRFVIIPAAVVAYIASTFFAFNFLAAMPIAGAIFSVLFFIKS